MGTSTIFFPLADIGDEGFSSDTTFGTSDITQFGTGDSSLGADSGKFASPNFAGDVGRDIFREEGAATAKFLAA